MKSGLDMRIDLINKLSIGIVLTDPEGEIIFTNKVIKKMTGYSEKEISNIEDWYKKAYPDQKRREKVKKLFKYDLDNNIKDRTYKIRTASGSHKYFNFSYSVLADDKMLFEIIDISHRIKEKKELKEVKERLELAISGADIGIWDWEYEEGYIHYNKKWAEMLGYKVSELANDFNVWFDLVHPDDKEQALKDIKEHLRGKTNKYLNEHRLRTKSDKWRWIRDIGKITERDESGNPLRIVGVHINIDQEKRTAEKIEFLSNHDELTGLYNRRYFNEELKRLDGSRRYPISIIVGDLNKLKTINDNFGHSMGDKYIKLAAESIKSAVRSEDLVARVGGDEFAVILPKTDYDTADSVNRRILENIVQKNKEEDLPKPLSIALGYETTDGSSENIDLKAYKDCYNKADKKMYEQKFAAGN